MGKLLFRIARLKMLGVFVGMAFAYVPFLIPIKKISQNANAVAFFHPAPSYTNHILIIPRKVAQTVFHLSPEEFIAVIKMAKEIRGSNDALLINGGRRQDVMQAHFHLFAASSNFEDRKEEKDFFESFNISKLKSKEAFSILIRFGENGLQTAYFI